MNIRSSKSKVTFSHRFALSGYTDELPAGEYDVTVEEELLQGLSFQAYRRTAAYLTVERKGRTEMRPISETELERALGRDRAETEAMNAGAAAHSPPEGLK